MTSGTGRAWTAPVAAMAFGAACLAIGVLVSLGGTAAFDEAVAEATVALHGGLWGAVVGAWGHAGDLGPWLLQTIVIGVALLAAGRRLSGIWVLLAFTADALAGLIKLVFALPRPPGVEILGMFGEPSYAYPSGHITRSVVLLGLVAWTLARELPAARRGPGSVVLVALAAIGVALMGAARVGVGEHWPSDVLGGVLLGLAWLCSVAWLDGRIAASPSRPR